MNVSYAKIYFVWHSTLIAPSHRVIQEVRSMFWEVTVSVIVGNKFHMNTCLIRNGYRDRAVWISRPNSVTFLFGTPDEAGSLQKKVDTRDELLSRILDAVGRIKKRDDQLRRTTRDLWTRAAQYIEVDGGSFEHLLWNLTDLSFMCNKSVI
jgi:hypothetical protein